MNAFGYESSEKDCDWNAEALEIVCGLQGDVDAPYVDALKSGTWKLSFQEINHIRHALESANKYLDFRYEFYKSLTTFPNDETSAFPIYSVIEPTSICNLRCVMCFQQDERLKAPPFRGTMTMETYKNAIDQLQEIGVRAITFAGRGEPFLNKNFSAFLDYASGKFFEIKVNTNGLLMTEEIARAILRNNVDMVVFSVEGINQEEYEMTRVGGSFDRLINNIEMFNELKKDYPDNNTLTRVSGVLVKDVDKAEYYNFWRKYVDEATLVQCEERSDTYNNDEVIKKSPCRRLWQRTYVWWNGDCSPCDVDYLEKLKFGNLNDTSLREIWNDTDIRKFRRLHLDGNRKNCLPCDRCQE